MYIQKIVILLITLSILKVDGIDIVYEKKNILIENNESYLFRVTLQKENADLIPSFVDIQYDIYNFNGTSNNYFDFFYYVSDADIQCYNSAIGNQSYLFPCPFLSNNYALVKTNRIKALNQMPKLEINKLQDLNYTFIIDNTKFPFPTGSYPYTDIYLNIKTTLSIDISSSYEQLTMRLVAINITVFFIFLFIILCLIWKQKKIQRIMDGHKKINQKETLLSKNNYDFETKKSMRNRNSPSPNQSDSDSQQQQNYTQFFGKTPTGPSSLLQSKQRSLFVERSNQ